MGPGEEMAGTQGNGDMYENLGLMPKREIFQLHDIIILYPKV